MNKTLNVLTMGLEPQDFWDWVFAIFMLLVFCALVIVVGYVIFYLIDSCGVTENNGAAVVYARSFTPAHWVTENKVDRWVPDTWDLSVVMNKMRDCCEVSKSRYNISGIGDTVNVAYKIGRISGKLYVIQVN